ncbi:MAG: hypothetical protein IJ912_03760 [Fibrobacter sp.]|nr:hypothetical protein [Fibrobacter sp.]MBR6123455.1 hypothetical protein [Candidatus Saccharibacteria bacterium]
MKIFKSVLVMSVLLTMLVACGDDSSSSVSPEPIGDSSSSVNQSSSSITDKGTSSGGSSVSSSDFFSSSSKTETVKSSSSALPKSSSSASIADQKIPCDKPEYVIYHIGDEEFVCKDSVLVPYIPPSSSSVQVRPFKERFKEDSVFNEEKTYGTFIDSRDGQEYRTIVIKKKYEQFEVFAQNLNYGTQVTLGTTTFDDSKVEKFCYDDDSWYCEHYFGGLYSWSETFGLPRACDSVWTGTTPNCPDSIAKGIVYDSDWNKLQIQGVCPDGWHVMNETEWRAMIGGEESAYMAMSKASNGSNSNGFSALFGGGAFYDENGCKYSGMAEYAHYWYPQELSDNAAKNIDLYKTKVDKASRYYKFYGLPVRCVKDYSSLLIN